MPTRRSARLQVLQNQGPISAENDSLPGMPNKTAKDKETVSELHEKPIIIRDAKRQVAKDDSRPIAKKARSEARGQKTEGVSAKSATSTATDLLWSCPREILNQILDNVR
jgi:glycerol-3-phosphate dehydrogenase